MKAQETINTSANNAVLDWLKVIKYTDNDISDKDAILRTRDFV